jgi:hypothetical protein
MHTHTHNSNHEQGDSGGECNVPYTYRFYTPAWEAAQQPTSAAGASRARALAAASLQDLPQRVNTNTSYYSFDMGGVHFLMLDSETPSHPSSPQGRFVAADLAQVRCGVWGGRG